VHKKEQEGTLDGVVKILEPMGREDLLHIETSLGEMLALSAEKAFRAGQRVGLSFEHDKLHVLPRD